MRGWIYGRPQYRLLLLLFVQKINFFNSLLGQKIFFWYVIFVYKVDFKMFFFNPFLCVMEAQCFFCDVGDEFLSIT